MALGPLLGFAPLQFYKAIRIETVKEITAVLSFSERSALGHKGDILTFKRYIRFTPESGHSVVFEECKGQKRTYAPQQMGRLFDNLIGALLERQGYVEAERLRSLEVDDEFKLGRNLDRQLPRTRTF
jgi:hypothetical protein